MSKFSKTSINKATMSIVKKLNFTKIEYSKKVKEIQNKIENEFNPQVLLEKAQAKLESYFNQETNETVLKQSSFWAKSITWSLMSGTVFAIGWISIAKTDEVVVATGKLEPIGGVVDIQMPIEGITKEILIKEGQKVYKGQTLIRLDTDYTKAENLSLNKTLELNQIIANKLEVLAKEGAVSEMQYIQQIAKIEGLKTQIKANEVKLKYQEIVSPIEGIVFELQPKSPGFVARTSQPVLQIVPTNNLIAKVEIDSRTIGFVKTGKIVDISIDSFPASDFGVIEGTVTRIGSDALVPKPSEGKGYRFPAKIELKNQFLKLKSGKQLPIQAGMSLTANIKLRKVTYLQLLLNKFGDKADSLKAI